jgi:hypothetical protein
MNYNGDLLVVSTTVMFADNSPQSAAVRTQLDDVFGFPPQERFHHPRRCGFLALRTNHLSSPPLPHVGGEKLEFTPLQRLMDVSKYVSASAGRGACQLGQKVLYIDQPVIKNLLGDIQELEDFRVGN